ncbi:hypothetical protein ACSBR1_037030 [Camellia fascicularis]
MGAQSMVVSMVLFVSVVVVVVIATTTVEDQCSNDFEKLVTCLNYATGKAAAPTTECCNSVAEIKDKDPVCLCYIIQQTYNGSEQIKNMGIQQSRLLQLPSYCKVTNASITDCPKLLNISASSPDYKIFTNPSSPSTTHSTMTGTSTTPASITTGTSLPIRSSNSSWSAHRPRFAGLVSIVMAIFFNVIPVEIMSTF